MQGFTANIIHKETNKIIKSYQLWASCYKEAYAMAYQDYIGDDFNLELEIEYNVDEDNPMEDR